MWCTVFIFCFPRGLDDSMSVTSEAAAAEAVESLADTAEDLEIDVEAGESSSEEEEEEGGKVLEPIAEGRVADPDSIGSVDPDPDSESGSGSRRAKMTHKSRKNFLSSCFEVLEGFFCNLNILYGCLGIGKL
jgi:hypothetical protein